MQSVTPSSPNYSAWYLNFEHAFRKTGLSVLFTYKYDAELLNGSITMCSQRNIMLYSVRQHNHFII